MKNIEAKRFNKVLILKDVKNFTYTIEELAYHTEMYKFLNDLELVRPLLECFIEIKN